MSKRGECEVKKEIIVVTDEGEKSYARIKGDVNEILNAVNVIFNTFTKRGQALLEGTQLVALIGNKASKIPSKKWTMHFQY